MTYCVVELDEHARVKRINVLFKTLSEAELSAAMLRKLHPACRYEAHLYVSDLISDHLPVIRSAQRDPAC
jgi:hypothetical protein